MESLPKFHVRRATNPSDLAFTKELFLSYANALPISLTFQNFTAELASLPGLYSPPTGAIFLAFLTLSDPNLQKQEPKPMGVIALRPLPSAAPAEKTCEMKRLYCSPESRGMGVGKALVEEVLNEARRLGYVEMKLDTLREMTGARKLYEGLGFVETEKYYETPVEGTVFMMKDLRV